MNNDEGMKEAIQRIVGQNQTHGAFPRYYIIDNGDMSRYHEIIMLTKSKNGSWQLVEDYLTPEYSFLRTTEIQELNEGTMTLIEWLEHFINRNKDIILGGQSISKEGVEI